MSIKDTKIDTNQLKLNVKSLKRRPSWIKISAPGGEKYNDLIGLMRSKNLHTVCEEAQCPNIGECWGAGTATFMMMGKICTRSCGFCDVMTGRPSPLDWNEPHRIALAVKEMNLNHAVITSVNRDELSDGGAPLFARVIQEIREHQPGCSIEVLIPDFKGSLSSLKTVMDARPEILNHNVETVQRLFKKVQPQDDYEWAKTVLINAKNMDKDVLTKTGIMVGLGETITEIKDTISEIRSWGVNILTVGQYLQPSRKHLPIERYYTIDEFNEIKLYAKECLRFDWVECAPLVRSSYRAERQVRALSTLYKKLY
ncbi:MAG TPA: lipoyl synthase [Chloroflexi bacterium]|nr:lipoyl synthase [Chloroflexota bacterium]|tara:strand:+ start:674 stop:1609 length:936 start_codon:yes stop_codon:yes gene_type:complete